MSESLNQPQTSAQMLQNTVLNAPSAAAQAAEGADCGLEAVNQTELRTENRQDPPSYDGLTLPEGFDCAPESWDAFKNLAREINLTPEQAQKLVEYEASLAGRATKDAADEKRRTLERWADETRALYGAKLEEAISYALRAADTFGGPDLRALLEDTGLGNHPVIIRTLSGVGKSISEDSFCGGKPSAPKDKTFAEALYGKQ